MFRKAIEAVQSLLSSSSGPGADVQYPLPGEWEHATPRQAARSERILAKLRKRAVPVFPGPLFVDDDEKVQVQSPAAVARRAMTLWGVNLRAEGFSQQQALEVIEGLDLWESLTAGEEAFLMATVVHPNECRDRVWRLEAIWVLLWALGHVKKLDWPIGMCDVEHLVNSLIPRHGDSTFITEATLRPVAELLDMQELTFRIHWAIRDAYLNHGALVPEKLDWTKKKRVPLDTNVPSLVVEQRHHAFNWLLNTFDPKDWDDVETHT